MTFSATGEAGIVSFESTEKDTHEVCLEGTRGATSLRRSRAFQGEQISYAKTSKSLGGGSLWLVLAGSLGYWK